MGRAESAQACGKLDKVFHEKARLGIVISLAEQPEGVSFSNLKMLCRLTDGNLFRHLHVLKGAGYVTLVKAYEGKRLRTRCALTKQGRARFADYLEALRQVIAGALAGMGSDLANTARSGPQRPDRLHRLQHR